MTGLTDTHCHLAHGRLKGSLTAVLARARQAGVERIICAAGDLRESHAAMEITKKHDNIWCIAGVHPHDAKDVNKDYLTVLAEYLNFSRNVAIGEIGLDYHYDFSPRKNQRRVFAEQLDLARHLDKPIIIHAREAFDDCLAILSESRVDYHRVVFHSFTGDVSVARRVIDLGAAVSFSGIVTFSIANALREAARLVPDERLLIETDSPYLSPEPLRKVKTNEPANVVHVAACLAKVRNSSPQAIAELTTANAVRLFGLDKAAEHKPD